MGPDCDSTLSPRSVPVPFPPPLVSSPAPHSNMMQARDVCLSVCSFFIAVELIYNVVLVSGVPQSDSLVCVYIYICLFRFFSHIGC